MTSPYQDDILHYPKKRDHVLRALARVLPPSCLIGTPEAMRPYTSDGLPVFSAMPLASGYRLSDNSDMPAAKVADEAKCGAQKAKEMQETKCGTSKEEKAPPKVLKDASCGEAKCGANKRRRL